MGNKGSAGLMMGLPRGDVVYSPRKESSWAMKDGNPEWEQAEVMGISLLASVKGGETGIVWKRFEES